MRRMSRMARSFSLVGVVLLALGLVACGDDEDTGDDAAVEESSDEGDGDSAESSEAGVAACEEAATFTVDNTVDEMRVVAEDAPGDVKEALQAVIDASLEQDVEAILEATKQVEAVCEGEYGVEIPTLDDVSGE